MNPMIYSAMSTDFRKAFASVVGQLKGERASASKAYSVRAPSSAASHRLTTDRNNCSPASVVVVVEQDKDDKANLHLLAECEEHA